MRLEFTDEEQSFREDVRSFLRERLSPDIAACMNAAGAA
jgi:hypothetical protein